jgi:hypothetical protein
MADPLGTTSAAHPFPAAPAQGFWQVVLPAFASILRSVSRSLVEPTPRGLPDWNRDRSVFGGVFCTLHPSFWCASETRPRPAGCPSSTPDCRPGRVLRLSLEVMPFLGTGQSSRTGIGPETHGSPGTDPSSAYSLAGSSAPT